MARVKTAKQSAPKHVEPEKESQVVPEPAPVPATPTAKAISKSGAARVAIDQGIENPTKASQFILKRYGIEMTPQHFSAVKSQYKKATESTPTPKGKPGRKPRPATQGDLAPPPKTAAAGGPICLPRSRL